MLCCAAWSRADGVQRDKPVHICDSDRSGFPPFLSLRIRSDPGLENRRCLLKTTSRRSGPEASRFERRLAFDSRLSLSLGGKLNQKTSVEHRSLRDRPKIDFSVVQDLTLLYQIVFAISAEIMYSITIIPTSTKNEIGSGLNPKIMPSGA